MGMEAFNAGSDSKIGQSLCKNVLLCKQQSHLHGNLLWKGPCGAWAFIFFLTYICITTIKQICI